MIDNKIFYFWTCQIAVTIGSSYSCKNAEVLFSEMEFVLLLSND